MRHALFLIVVFCFTGCGAAGRGVGVGGMVGRIGTSFRGTGAASFRGGAGVNIAPFIGGNAARGGVPLEARGSSVLMLTKEGYVEVYAGNRLRGTVTEENGSIIVRNSQGVLIARILRSGPYRMNIMSPDGKMISYATFEPGNRINYYNPDGKLLAYDVVNGKRALHYDLSGKLQGKSFLEADAPFFPNNLLLGLWVIDNTDETQRVPSHRMKIVERMEGEYVILRDEKFYGLVSGSGEILRVYDRLLRLAGSIRADSIGVAVMTSKYHEKGERYLALSLANGIGFIGGNPENPILDLVLCHRIKVENNVVTHLQFDGKEHVISELHFREVPQEPSFCPALFLMIDLNKRRDRSTAMEIKSFRDRVSEARRFLRAKSLYRDHVGSLYGIMDVPTMRAIKRLHKERFPESNGHLLPALWEFPYIMSRELPEMERRRPMRNPVFYNSLRRVEVTGLFDWRYELDNSPPSAHANSDDKPRAEVPRSVSSGETGAVAEISSNQLVDFIEERLGLILLGLLVIAGVAFLIPVSTSSQKSGTEKPRRRR